MLKVKNVGKPDEGKLHVRFDEEGQVSPYPLLYQDCISGLEQAAPSAFRKI
jgi:hypothetical protein